MRVALLALLALVSGCAGPPAPDATPAEAEAQGVSLTLAAEPTTLAPGVSTVVTAFAQNRGADATYATGGCGSAPWRFEIVAPDGTRVGPLGPDPRCLGAPMQELAFARGANLTARLSWDGDVKERDASGEIQRQRAPPGVYTIRALLDLARDGEAFAPSAAVQVVVE